MAKRNWLERTLRDMQLELARTLTPRQLNDYRKRLVVPSHVLELHKQIAIFKQELGGVL